MCWADNVVGQQKEPCVFHLIAAGKPEMPYNCSLVNQTSESLEVDCAEGNYFTIICLSHQLQFITDPYPIRSLPISWARLPGWSANNGLTVRRQMSVLVTARGESIRLVLPRNDNSSKGMCFHSPEIQPSTGRPAPFRYHQFATHQSVR
uniref:Uncharacterized protein n=1 Tax=Anopheles maculatus TaxID=74869 RepID=A0A182S9E4_9DIPT